MNKPAHPADEFGLKRVSNTAEKAFATEAAIAEIGELVKHDKPLNDPLTLIAVDILAAPFGRMLEFGEELEKAKQTKIEGSPAVANAYMMHEWAKNRMEEWKKKNDTSRTNS